MMADSNGENDTSGLPPKISIPIPASRPPLDLGSADDDGDDAATTMQINLDDGKASSAPKPTTPPPANEPEDDFDDAATTMQINLDDGKASSAPKPTTPPPANEPEDDFDDAATTMQINLDDGKAGIAPSAPAAKPAVKVAAKPAAKLSPKVAPSVERVVADASQGSTMHLDLSATDAEESVAKPELKAKASVVRPKAKSADQAATMSIDLTSKSGEKISPKPSGPASAGGDMPKTIRVKPILKKAEPTEKTQQIDLTKNTAGAAPRTIRVKPVARANKPGASDAKKGETSRIPLEDAMKSESGGIAPVGKALAAPKTIRIKPKADAPTIQRKAPVASDDQKSETSRLSLQDALASEQSEQAAAPKTIRLKRPSEASTIKVQRPRKTTNSGTPEEESDTGATNTRKKTIKLKRPDREEGSKKVTLKRGAADEPEEEEQPQLVLQSDTGPEVIDQPGWFFAVLSFVALGVIGTTIYMFAVQTPFGVRDKSDWSKQQQPEMIWTWPQQFPHDFGQ